MHKRGQCGILLAALLAVSALPACGGRVLLVEGTVSAPDAAERNYAKKVTDRLSRWMKQAGVAHEVTTDEGVTGKKLAGVSAVVLGYNPYLAKGERQALEAFMARGGKVIVFYSADAALASAMGLRLGDYMRTEAAGRWSAMVFTGNAGPGFPEKIYQESRNIRPVEPAVRGAQVLAFWEDGQGKRREPAVVSVPRGAWVTHILLDDGDTVHKTHLLVALLGLAEPQVWREAALHRLGRLGSGRQFADLAQAISVIRGAAAGSKHEVAVRKRIARILDLREAAAAAWAAKHYPDVLQHCAAVDHELAYAYAVLQAPVKGEFRGVWEHTGLGTHPGDWDATCRVLAESGVTAVFANMLWPRHAHYASKLLPASPEYGLYGDLLADCARACKRHGLELHVWKVCWRLGSASPSVVDQLKKENRLQVNDEGVTLRWLCPTDPRNRADEIASLVEVTSRYEVTGVHLDYIRYDHAHVCFCEGCRRRFARDERVAVSEWPLDPFNSKLAGRYSRWRRDQITSFVKEVAGAVRNVDPELRISAAVYGKYPSCVRGVGQDWVRWLHDGTVDFVCPMNYTTDAGEFEKLVRVQMAMPGARQRIYPGIGVTAAESRLGAMDTIDQVVAARRARTAGLMLYSLNRVLEAEILPVLKEGVFKDAKKSPSR